MTITSLINRGSMGDFWVVKLNKSASGNSNADAERAIPLGNDQVRTVYPILNNGNLP